MAAGEASSASSGRTDVHDLVADRDLAAAHHVRIDARPVHEAAHRPRRSHRLEVIAGLAELDAHGLDAADREAPPDQRVHVDPARRHLAPALARLELDPGLALE